jgi:uncharacterized protein (TIGR03437 family)
MRIRAIFLSLAATVVAYAQPTIGGLTNAASFSSPPLTGGSLVSIFGTNLAKNLAQADSIPLSTNLGGVTVKFTNGSTSINAPLLFVVGSQINVQVPWDLVPPNSTQNVSVVVTTDGVPSPPATVSVGPFSPGIFATGPPDLRAIAQNFPDGTLAQPVGSIPGLITRPAKVGDAIIIYATGLGAVDGPVANGAAAFLNTLTKPVVLVGGVQAPLLFSGLQPQFVGVNQVNILIPDVPAGDKVPLQIQMGGITSPATTTIAVTR